MVWRLRSAVSRDGRTVQAFGDPRPADKVGPGDGPAERERGRVVYEVARRVLGLLFRVLWRPRVEGLEHVPRRGAVLLASNHLSFSDSVVLPLLVPRRVQYLAKSDYFTGTGVRGRAVAWWFRSIGAVPVRRTGRADDAMDALSTALAILRTGGAFALYPEGTRSRDGRLYRGRTGVAWLALESRAPVVPVTLDGTQHLQPIGARLPRLHRVRVVFHPSLAPGPYLARVTGGESAGRVRRDLTDAVMQAIASQSPQERAAGYNEGSSTEFG
jgi:1-acyl-sn-glycerol-3-phosphate acyltransferase